MEENIMNFLVKTGARIQGLASNLSGHQIEDFNYILTGIMEFSSDQLVRIYEANKNFDQTLYVFHNPHFGGTDYFINLEDLEVLH
tara:strand:- start:577 stop:831 length:255 start_codon:yes stop_codon:yes gene_type:complete